MVQKKSIPIAKQMPSRVQKRLAQRAKILETKSAAKSRMHEDVVERPMDKNLSKLLEIRRAQKSGSGSSIKRLKHEQEKEEEERLAASVKLTGAYDEESEEDRATSVKRLRPNRLPLANLPANVIHPTSTKGQLGDLSG